MIHFIVLACVLLMLPRILSAQFGLLDDGVLLWGAKATLQSPSLIWTAAKDVGRFLPSVFLLRSVIFALAGYSARRWYLLTLAQLIATCLPMALLMRRNGSSQWQGALAGVILLGSPSLVENFYTLSKSEVQLVMLLAWTLLIGSRYKISSTRFQKIIVISITLLLMLLSISAKETTIVLPFLFLSWLLIDQLFLRKTETYCSHIRIDLIYFLCSIASVLIYWAARSLLGYSNIGSSSFSSGYQVFNFQAILDNLLSMVGWLVRDNLYLIPAILAWIFVKPIRQAANSAVLLKWSAWMLVWLGVLLPWKYVAYYLFPFQFGAAIFSGMVLGDLLKYLWLLIQQYRANFSRPRLRSLVRQGGMWALALSFLLLILPPVVNATAFATEQLTFDLSNWRFVQQVLKLPQNSRLILSLSQDFEYFSEIKLTVGTIHNRPDITIEPYQYPVQVVPDQNTYLAYITFQNEVLPSVRGIDSDTADLWNACLETERVASQKIFSSKIIRPILDISLNRLIPDKRSANLLGTRDRKVVVKTNMTYSWTLSQFSPTKPYAAHPGVYKNGIFTLQTASGKIRKVAFGQWNEEPLTGDLNGDGFTDLVMYDPVQHSMQIDFDLDGKADETFHLSGIQPGDLLFLGDWNGDGKETPGFFRSSETAWYIYKSISDPPEKVLKYGSKSDLPIVGDWDGDGKTEFGVYHPDNGATTLRILLNNNPWPFLYQGEPNSTPVVGYWEATSRSELAFSKNNQWKMMFSLGFCLQPSPVKQFIFDYAGVPLAGVWKDQ